MLRTVLEILKREIKSVNADFYCEIEYDGKYEPDWIDIRIYGDGFVPVSDMVLNRLLNNGTIKRNWNNSNGEYYVEIPSEEEVKFGFSGIKVERISIDIDKDLQDKNLSVLLQIDKDYEIEA